MLGQIIDAAPSETVNSFAQANPIWAMQSNLRSFCRICQNTVNGSMLTDKPPRKSNLAAFTESDRMRTIDLPQDGSLRIIAKSVECAMKAGTTTNVRHVCQEFLETTSRFYGVPDCEIRVLAARPLRVRENWA